MIIDVNYHTDKNIFLNSSFHLMQDQEQEGTRVVLTLKIFTKRYKQSNTFNDVFTVMQQDTLMRYSGTEIINMWCQKIKRSQENFRNNLQCKWQERCFQDFSIPLLELESTFSKTMIKSSDLLTEWKSFYFLPFFVLKQDQIQSSNYVDLRLQIST